MTSKDPLVVFTPSGKRGRFPRGTQLLQAARSLGVDVDSVCGGRAICGHCQVRPTASSTVGCSAPSTSVMGTRCR